MICNHLLGVRFPLGAPKKPKKRYLEGYKAISITRRSRVSEKRKFRGTGACAETCPPLSVQARSANMFVYRKKNINPNASHSAMFFRNIKDIPTFLLGLQHHQHPITRLALPQPCRWLPHAEDELLADRLTGDGQFRFDGRTYPSIRSSEPFSRRRVWRQEDGVGFLAIGCSASIMTQTRNSSVFSRQNTSSCSRDILAVFDMTLWAPCRFHWMHLGSWVIIGNHR